MNHHPASKMMYLSVGQDIEMESLFIILRLVLQYKLGRSDLVAEKDATAGPVRSGPARPGQGPAVTSQRPN